LSLCHFQLSLCPAPDHDLASARPPPLERRARLPREIRRNEMFLFAHNVRYVAFCDFSHLILLLVLLVVVTILPVLDRLDRWSSLPTEIRIYEIIEMEFISSPRPPPRHLCFRISTRLARRPSSRIISCLIALTDRRGEPFAHKKISKSYLSRFCSPKIIGMIPCHRQCLFLPGHSSCSRNGYPL